ncbi:MAG: patatin-like phospholipase family protein [Pseudomonadota bacterium]|nr:patatin-like phospholipase family protein [Pseudomonadota bacterium]
MKTRVPRIGLALGSGSARGWAHIGVLRALLDAGVQPQVVAGTSIGALVGAAYAAGELDRFEQWVRSLSARAVWAFMDFGLSGGMLKGEKLVDFMRTHVDDRPLEQLPLAFAAVATDLHTGDEVWLREGSVAEVVRASCALPGLFAPVWQGSGHSQRLLADGGLVNPVPVSLARALGADAVIAVDLNSDLMGRHLRAAPTPPAPRTDWVSGLKAQLGAWGTLRPAGAPPGAAEDAATDTAANTAADAAQAAPAPAPPLPSVLHVLASSINVMQVRITRSRMAGEPPEALIAPRLAHLGLLDFHHASEAIDAGRAATAEALPLLRARGLLPDAS